MSKEIWTNVWISILLAGGLAFILLHLQQNHGVEWPLVGLITAIFITALALRFPRSTFDLLKSFKFPWSKNGGGLE